MTMRAAAAFMSMMVHQCVSEDAWFRNMLGIDVGAPPLPAQETRLEFMKRYAEDSGHRLERLRQTDEESWEAMTTSSTFVAPGPGDDAPGSRTHRITAGSRWPCFECSDENFTVITGQPRIGGLMQNHAPTIYAYSSLGVLLERESHGDAKAPLPLAQALGGTALTERPTR